MSPSVIERLKPYFKTRPRPRPGAAPPPAPAQNATAPATPAQPTPGAAPAPAPTPQAQPAKPKKRRGLRRKPRAAPAPARRPPRRRSPRQPKPSRRRPRPPRAPSRPGAPQADAGLLASRREQLSREFAQLQSDLGGLVYEMAIRDQFRLDLVVRQAAKLQAVDAELTAVERALGIATSEPRRPLPVVRLAGAARRRVLRPLRRRRSRAACTRRRPPRRRAAAPGPPARRPASPRARPVGGAAADSRADPGRHSRSDPDLAGPGTAGAGR